MTKFTRLHRTLSSILAAALTLSTAAPSYALKQEQTTQTGLEEDLRERLLEVARAFIPQEPASPVSVRPEPLPAGRQVVEGRPLSAAGLEEARNPFARGVVPSAEVLERNRLSVRTTDLIAAGVYATGLVGGNNRDAVDGLAQDIFTQAHRVARSNPHMLWFEGAKHNVYGEGVEYMVHEGGITLSFPGVTGETPVLADVTENTNAIIRGQQDRSGAGGTSLYLTGPLAKAFGSGRDELGAAIILGAVPHDKMQEFLPSRGGRPIDPDDDVIGNIQRLLDANGIGWEQAEVFYQERDRSRSEVLFPLQAMQTQHPGMELRLIKDGTMDGGLLSILGRTKGKYPVFVGTAGSTEGAYKYLNALIVDGVVVGFRLYSPFSKNVGDAVGSLRKTLGDLTPEEVAKVKEKTKLDDKAYGALPKDVPIRYLFTPEQIEALREVRPQDYVEITSRSGKLFHNETYWFPRSSNEPTGIRRDGPNGPVLIPDVTEQDLILSSSLSVILASGTLGIDGPKTLSRSVYQVEHLVLERSNGRTYVWVAPAPVTWQDLHQLTPRHFISTPPEVRAALPATDPLQAGLEESDSPKWLEVVQAFLTVYETFREQNPAAVPLSNLESYMGSAAGSPDLWGVGARLRAAENYLKSTFQDGSLDVSLLPLENPDISLAQALVAAQRAVAEALKAESDQSGLEEAPQVRWGTMVAKATGFSGGWTGDHLIKAQGLADRLVIESGVSAGTGNRLNVIETVQDGQYTLSVFNGTGQPIAWTSSEPIIQDIRYETVTTPNARRVLTIFVPPQILVSQEVINLTAEADRFGSPKSVTLRIAAAAGLEQLEEVISVDEAVDRIMAAYLEGVRSFNYVPMRYAPVKHFSEDFSLGSVQEAVRSASHDGRVRYRFDPGSQIPIVEPENLATLNQGVFPADENPWMPAGLEEVGQALKEFSTRDRYWAFDEAAGQMQARAVLVDASHDFSVSWLALALSVMMARNNVPEMDFRLVIRAGEKESLRDQLVQAGAADAVDYLLPRILEYHGDESLDDARRTAMGQLAQRFGFDKADQMRSAGALHVVSQLTLDLAVELRVFFSAGGLNFVTDEAYQRFEAVLKFA